MPRRAVDAQGTARAGQAQLRGELEGRGATVRTVREGRVDLLEVSGPGELPRRRVRVKTRRSGTWQASTADGAADPERPSVPTYWAFVDLAVDPPRFCFAEDATVRRDIHTEHGAYLERHGGRRVHNDASKHHAITLARVERWARGWELLGLEPMKPEV